MNPPKVEQAAWLARLAPWLILALPILVGFLFWADSCGHADSIGYRELIAATWKEGRLPLGRMEWLHPGQYILAAPIFGIGKELGAWDEALRVCSLLNFLALGWAGMTVFQMVRELFPKRSTSLAFLMGISVVSVPGWLWMSQMALTDVLGHAMILTWSCRLLIHEARTRAGKDSPETRLGRTGVILSWSFTGFLATYAILIRVSSSLSFFVFVYLALRATLASPDKKWRTQKAVALILGGVAPLLVVYGHYIQEYGWTVFWRDYLKFSSDNTGLRESLEVIVTRWIEHARYGAGPVLTWVGGTGALLFFFHWLIRPKAKFFSDRRVIFWIAFLLSLPYFVAVARNRAWYEFRYMLPLMAFLSLGVLSWGWLVDRFLGSRVTTLLAVALLVLNLIQAGPWLQTFGSRTHFSEEAARRISEVVEPGSLVIAHMAGAHIEYQSKQRFGLIGVRHSPSATGPDLWNRSWMEARLDMQNALANHRNVYSLDEESLMPFKGELERQGWRIECVKSIPFDWLRNAYDSNLATMKMELALKPLPIRILRYHPPAGADIPLVRIVPSEEKAEDGILHFNLFAQKLKGLSYRLLFYKEVQDEWLHLPGQIMLPTTSDDPTLLLSSGADSTSSPDLHFLSGELDEQGFAHIEIPHSVRKHLLGTKMVALIHDSNTSWRNSRVRSRGIPIQ